MARQYAEGKEEFRAIVTYTVGDWKNPPHRTVMSSHSEIGKVVTEIYGPYKSEGSARTAAKAAVRATYHAYWFNLVEMTIKIQKADITWTDV